MQSIKSELNGYRQGIEKELNGDMNLDTISKMGHKLLPIASMLQMKTIEAIKTLSPEHIKALNSDNTRKILQEIWNELTEIIG